MSNLQKEIIKKIQDDFNNIISYSQDIDEPKTDLLFAQWEKNKAKFIELFGGLTYEFPEKVNFHSNKRQRHEKFRHFLYECRQYYDIEGEPWEFLESQEDGFFDNEVVVDNQYTPVGSKLSKSLKLFINDKERLTGLQNLMSRYIQEEVMTGKLVLSVHPLDYLTISDNNHNWSSCHSLEGERRVGNLNYMADSTTVLCYITSGDLCQMEALPNDLLWNSKKWRMILYLGEDNNLMFAGRQYPYEINGSREFVRDIMNGLLHKEMTDWVHVHGCRGEWSPCPVNGVDYPIESLIQDNEYTFHFNDCLFSSCYRPFYTYDPSISKEIKPIIVGEAVECFKCGSAHIDFDHQMWCNDCGDGFYCDVCGDYESDRDDAHNIDGRLVCDSCFREQFVICSECGGYHMRVNCTQPDERMDLQSLPRG